MTKQAESFIEKEYLNMYDYFQDSKNLTKVEHFDYISYWENDCNYELRYVPNSRDIRIYDSSNFIMYVRFLDPNYKTLDYINYFDMNGKKSSVSFMM